MADQDTQQIDPQELDRVRQLLLNARQPAQGLQTDNTTEQLPAIAAPGRNGTASPAIMLPAEQSANLKAPRLKMPAIAYPSLGISDETQQALDLASQMENSKSGLDNWGDKASGIRNPILRGLARVGVGGLKGLQAIGDFAAPEVTGNIPGTDLYRQRTTKEAEREATQALARDQQTAQVAQEQALANETAMMPDLKEAGIEATAQRYANQLNAKEQGLTNQMIRAGYRVATDPTTGQVVRDEAGNVQYEVDPGSPVTKKISAQSDYITAQKNLADSRAQEAEAEEELKRAQNDPSSPTYRLAYQKLLEARERTAVLRESVNVSAQRLGFDQEKFYNPQPTSSERTKKDLGQSVLYQTNTIRDIINRRSDLFGPGAGRETKFTTWIGSQDPDAQRYITASKFLAEHGNGMFGSRSSELVKDAEGLLDPKITPRAINATLGQYEGTAKEFINAGTLHGPANTTSVPTGNNGTGRTASRGANGPTTQSGFTRYSDGGRTYRIPANLRDDFLKDHPNARAQ